MWKEPTAKRYQCLSRCVIQYDWLHTLIRLSNMCIPYFTGWRCVFVRLASAGGISLDKQPISKLETLGRIESINLNAHCTQYWFRNSI